MAFSYAAACILFGLETNGEPSRLPSESAYTRGRFYLARTSIMALTVVSNDMAVMRKLV